MRPRILLVTGTDTEIGKTAASAALAAAGSPGRSVHAVKVVQAGLEDGRSDTDTISRLAGVSTTEIVRLRHPMAPQAAARLEGTALPSVSEVAAVLQARAEQHDLLVVEGSGGVAVRLTSDDGTLVDIGLAVAGTLDVAAVVVARAGLGTLNHAELTVDYLRARRVQVAGLMIGSWPKHPSLVQQENLRDLPRVSAAPVLSRLPAGCPDWPVAEFRGWARSHVPAEVLTG